MRESENKEKQGSSMPSQNFSKFVEEKPMESNAIQIPHISLPKGGGALKGIDEKFEVNAANGMASFSIPLPITPGRNNFSPSLSLSYNSGAGNSPFGMGWSLNSPTIQRKTDKALPRDQEVAVCCASVSGNFTTTDGDAENRQQSKHRQNSS